MSSSDFLVEFCSTQESFRHLRALLAYASNNAKNESSLYGAVNFILTLFCTSAKVTATKSKNLYLGSFPQKDLKKSRPGKKFRAPDFTVLVVQSAFSQQSTEEKIEDTGPLLWEVKASQEKLTWFGERRSELDLAVHFFKHFNQVVAQVVFAKAKFNQKPIYILLSIDIWFVLLHFPGDPPSLVWTMKGGKSKTYLPPLEFYKFYNYMAVAPTRIFNEDCTAFSPEFLYALQLSVANLTDVTVTPHPSFRAPEGTAELISTKLEKYRSSAKFEEEGRRAEIENKFAMGEEDTDERSAGWSAPEEPETDVENQKHPAAVPATVDHLLTSPAKTRSKATALKSHAPAKASTQAGPSNEAANIAGPSRNQGAAMVNPVSVGKARLPAVRTRRKAAAEKTIGYKKDVHEQPVEDD
ncbi:hypothetical protein OG21DRAFT_1518379 [Imleria badia]|nr:hypothetical protein OG21DRAFT_1518379 [Imleria badia]